MIKGLVLICVLLFCMSALPLSSSIKQDISDSWMASRLIEKGTLAEGLFRNLFNGKLKETAPFLTVSSPVATNDKNILDRSASEQIILKPEDKIDLGFSVADPKEDVGSESKMLYLVNQERAAAGLGELKTDKMLLMAARNHGKDMFARGYFSHFNLEGLSPFDRLEKLGIGYEEAGENLAMAPTCEQAHAGLMSSPGHRANILDPKFGRVGIAVLDGGIYGKIFVQEFEN